MASRLIRFIAALGLLLALIVCQCMATPNMVAGTYCGFLPNAGQARGTSVTITVSGSQWLRMSIYDIDDFVYYADPPFQHCSIEGEAIINGTRLMVNQRPAKGVRCYAYFGDAKNQGFWNTSGAIPMANYSNTSAFVGFRFQVSGRFAGLYNVSQAACLMNATIDNGNYCSVEGSPDAVMLQVRRGMLGIYAGNPLNGDTYAFEDLTTGTVPGGLHGNTVVYFPDPARGVVPLNAVGTLLSLNARRLWFRVVTVVIPPCPASLPARFEPIRYEPTSSTLFTTGTFRLPTGSRFAFDPNTETYCYGANVPRATSVYAMVIRDVPAVTPRNWVTGASMTLNITLSQAVFVSLRANLTSQCPVFNGLTCGVLPNNISISYNFDSVQGKYRRTLWAPPNFTTLPFPTEACVEDAEFTVLSGAVMVGGVTRSNGCNLLDRNLQNYSYPRMILRNRTLRQELVTIGARPVTSTIDLLPSNCLALPEGNYAGASGGVFAGAVVFQGASKGTLDFVLHLSNASTGDWDCQTRLFIAGGTVRGFGGSTFVDSSRPMTECNAAIRRLTYDPASRTILLQGSAASQRGVRYGNFTISLSAIRKLPSNAYCGLIPGVTLAGGLRRDIAATLEVSRSQYYTLTMFFTDVFTPWDYAGARRRCKIEGSAVATAGGVVRLLPVRRSPTWCGGIEYEIRATLFANATLPSPTYTSRTGYTFSLLNRNGSRYNAVLSNALCNARIPDGEFCTTAAFSGAAVVTRHQATYVRSEKGILSIYDGNMTTGNTFCFDGSTSGSVATEISGDCDVIIPRPSELRPLTNGIQFAARRLFRQTSQRVIPACPSVIPSQGFFCNLMDLDKTLPTFDTNWASKGLSGAPKLVWMSTTDNFCYFTAPAAIPPFPSICNINNPSSLTFTAATRTYSGSLSERIYRDVTANMAECPVMTGEFCGVIGNLPNPVGVSVEFNGFKFTRTAWIARGSTEGLFTGGAACRETGGYRLLTGTIMMQGTQRADECNAVLPAAPEPMRIDPTNSSVLRFWYRVSGTAQLVNLTRARCTPDVPVGSFLGTTSTNIVVGMNVYNANAGQQAIIFMRRVADRLFNCSTVLQISAGIDGENFAGVRLGGTSDTCGLRAVTRFAFDRVRGTFQLTATATRPVSGLINVTMI
jgi:hypothetical protein